MSANIVIAAFYKFTALPDHVGLRGPLLGHGRELGLKGTILLAHEGINGTIAGSRPALDRFLAYLRQHPQLHDLLHKESYAAEAPFHRFKVKLKSEIVTMGLPEIDPTQQVGTYVPPQAWNALLQDPEILLIDTRNDYEYHAGTFQNAVNPDTFSFREFPRYVAENLDPHQHPKVAMFCTGGIRCEKATAYLLGQGFREVYHLQGGILKYLEEVPPEESLWEGECFVFDDRVTVRHDLSPGSYVMCYACKRPLTAVETTTPAYEEGISCPHCIHTLTADRRERLAERHKQVLLAEARGEQHIGRQYE